MPKKKYDNITLHAGNIREPESTVRDDYSKPTFAETEMKLQGTKAYEFNARNTQSRATTAKKEEYKDKSGHHFMWYKQIHLPVMKLKPNKKKLAGKSKRKDYSVLVVILVVFAIMLFGYVSSNWESIRPIVTTSTDEKLSELPVHTVADNEYDTGAQCVGAFLKFVCEGDGPNAMRCLDSYGRFSYFGCETEMMESAAYAQAGEAYFARSLLRDLIDAYDSGSEFVNLRYDIDDYSFRASPSLLEGRHIIKVNMEITTADGYQTINLNIPTVTYGGNYYISYENIS